MTGLLSLIRAEGRLLVRESAVLVFGFGFPPLVMVILAGAFGSKPDPAYGPVPLAPDHYYVAAYLAVPLLALALIGLPVALASYRERGVLRRFEAFGVSAGTVVAAQAVVTCGLVLAGAAVVLAIAAPTYGIPHLADPGRTAVGFLAGAVTLMLLGVAIGLAVPTARAAQAVGLLAFFPMLLLGGGGPPRGAMTGAMRSVGDVLPPAIGAIRDPWLGNGDLGPHLLVLAAWAAAAALAVVWLGRRRSA